MRQMEMEEEVIDLSELLRLLWSHVLQIVAVGLVAGGDQLSGMYVRADAPVSGVRQHDRQYPAG